MQKWNHNLAHTRSAGVQTSITVVNNAHFEILPDKDDHPWRETSSHMDKELLRARIAQELIMLALELRRFAGLEGVKAICHKGEGVKSHGLLHSGRERILVQEDPFRESEFAITGHGTGGKAA